MKKSKNLSLFRVAILFLISAYFQNNYIFIFSFFYLMLVNRKEALIYLGLIIINIIVNYYFFDFISIGYIENISKDYIDVNKYLYKTRVYTNIENIRIGYLIKTSNLSNKNLSENLLKYNIKFINNENIEILKRNTLFYKTYLKTSLYDSNVSLFIRKILFNEYIDNNQFDIFTGYGLTSYIFLKYIFRKNKNLSILILFLITIFFGFETKYILILIDYFFSFIKDSRLNKYSYKLIIITIINIYLIFNYSFLISILFELMNFININKKLSICIIQSLLFGESNILISLFYNYYLYIPILYYLLCLLILLIPKISIYIFYLIKFISTFINYLSLNIKGEMNIIFILIVIIISKYLNNDFILLSICYLLILCPLNNPLFHISFIDVGQGDAILIKGEFEKYNILIDTGSTYNYSKLKRFLDKEGIYKIDYLVITHNDSDHNGNTENLLKDYKIRNIINKPVDIKINYLYLKNLYIDYYDNDNENSLVYLLNKNDFNFIFTGDITKNVEKQLINKYKLENIDVLKVSHHGSNTATSNYFISSILPRFAVISTNGNYGHPKKEVIDILNSFLVKTYITKNDKNVSFYILNKYKWIKSKIYHFDIINP